MSEADLRLANQTPVLLMGLVADQEQTVARGALFRSITTRLMLAQGFGGQSDHQLDLYKVGILQQEINGKKERTSQCNDYSDTQYFFEDSSP